MRSLVRLESVLVNMLFLYFIAKITPIMMAKNIYPSVIAAAAMFLILYLPNEGLNVFELTLHLLLALIIYIAVILLFPGERKILFKYKLFIK
jgi:hypothetical protein